MFENKLRVFVWMCLYILWYCKQSVFWIVVEAKCPERCLCRNISEGTSHIRVKCGSEEYRLNNWQMIDMEGDFSNVLNLDLSKNAFNNIDKVYLLKFTELKRLDLSSNLIKAIDKDTFGEGLNSLERLRLSNNSISHIYLGSFDNFPHLKQLDISSNPLVCNCDLIWLIAWSNANLIKLQPSPKCNSPEYFKDYYLKKLRVGLDLHCETPMQPILELIPKRNQVVFEGDQLILKCRAPRVAFGVPKESEDLPSRANVFWGWSNKILPHNSTENITFFDPVRVLNDVHIESKHSTDSGILNSHLRINDVRRNHSGTYDCTLRSPQANLSQAIAVIVIHSNTQYCKALDITTNKGSYHWPQTVRGHTVEQVCVESIDSSFVATYHCDDSGVWQNLSIDMCSYVNPITRLLEEFAKMNLTLKTANVLEIAKSLHNFTHNLANLKRIRDPIDLEFIARTLLKYLEFVPYQTELSHLLLDIVSQLMLLPAVKFYEAQHLYESGRKLLTCVEVASAQAALHSPNHDNGDIKDEKLFQQRSFFIEYFTVSAELFTGISCVWVHNLNHNPNEGFSFAFSQSTFECLTVNDTFLTFEPYIHAGVHIPATFLHDYNKNRTNSWLKLMVAVFQNADLLPHLNHQDRSVQLTSPMIGVKLADGPHDHWGDLESNAISIILRVHPYHDELGAPQPAWWDDNKKEWKLDSCQQLYLHRGLLMFTCNNLGYYGLLQRANFLNDFPTEEMGARFRFSPLAIYLGSSVLFVCLIINLVTFLSFARAIHGSRQQQHILLNSWLALAILCFIFTVGIFQTESQNLCRLIGILIHYFSLCVLLWLCVSLSTMYKSLSKHQRISDELDLPKDVYLRKPIMGLYLVGWGIAMIICGISGAVNAKEYASYGFCFLNNASAMNAMLVPGGILLIFLCVLFTTIYYQLTHHNYHGALHCKTQFSDNTQATENIDLDWLDSTHSNTGINRNINSGNRNRVNTDQYTSLTLSNGISSSIENYERSNLSYLRANFVFLILYVTAWLSAVGFVMNTAKDFEDIGNVYSILFAISCCLLGLFLLLFYTIARSEIRQQWNFIDCYKKARYCNGSYNDIVAPVANSVLVYKQSYENDAANNSGASRTNSQSSRQHSGSIVRSITVNSGNNPSMPLAPPVINNQHLSLGITHEIPSADIFYNPNQINVARKFFKKQKRLAKRNNFDLQRQVDRCHGRCDNASDTSSADASGPVYSRRHNAMTMKLLSSGLGKVNNTNIHYRTENNANCKNLSNLQQMLSKSEKMQRNDESPTFSLDTKQSNQLNKDTIMSMNIYTNMLEVVSAQQDIPKVRAGDSKEVGDSGMRSGMAINGRSLNTLEEYHEDLDDQCDSVSCEENVPLYENTRVTNTTTTPLNNLFNSMFGELKRNEADNTQENKLEDETLLLNHNEVEAMNSLGLPTEVQTNQNENYQIAGGGSDEALNEEPTFQRYEVYVSNPLQITNRVQIVDDVSPVWIQCGQQQQSKSLNNLDDIFSIRNREKCTWRDKVDFQDVTKLPNISKRYSSLADNILTDTNIKSSESGTERLSSLGQTKIRHSTTGKLYSSNNKTSSAVDLYRITHDLMHSASPTNESDFNYQNSEISIRSHGVYAPQIDNDITLTEDFPYQSCDASEMEGGFNDFDDEFSHFGSLSLTDDIDGSEQNQMECGSIDELYEAIKHGQSNNKQPNMSNNGNNDNASTAKHLLLHPNKEHSQTNIKTENILVSNSGSTIDNKSHREHIMEDDSSQSSVISYIDSKTSKSNFS